MSISATTRWIIVTNLLFLTHAGRCLYVINMSVLNLIKVSPLKSTRKHVGSLASKFFFISLFSRVLGILSNISEPVFKNLKLNKSPTATGKGPFH